MVKLLECQEECALDKDLTADRLRTFAIALLCSLLEIFEIDLTAAEIREIEQFCEDWGRK